MLSVFILFTILVHSVVHSEHVLKNVNNNLVVEDTPKGTIVTTWKAKASQKWQAIALKRDVLKFKNIKTGKFLQAHIGGILTVTRPASNSPFQLWMIRKGKIWSKKFTNACLYHMGNIMRLYRHCDDINKIVMMPLWMFKNNLNRKPAPAPQKQTTTVPVDVQQPQQYNTMVPVDVNQPQTHNTTVPVDVKQPQAHNTTVPVDVNQLQTHNTTLPVDVNQLQTYNTTAPVDVKQPQTDNTTVPIDGNVKQNEYSTESSSNITQWVDAEQLMELQVLLKTYSVILNNFQLNNTPEILFLTHFQNLVNKYTEHNTQDGMVIDQSFFLALNKLLEEYSIAEKNININPIITSDELFVVELQSLLKIYSALFDNDQETEAPYELFLAELQNILSKYLMIFNVPPESDKFFFGGLWKLLQKYSMMLNEKPPTGELNETVIETLQTITKSNTMPTSSQEDATLQKMFLQRLQKLMKKYSVVLNGSKQCDALSKLFLADLVELQETNSLPPNNTGKCEKEVSVTFQRFPSNKTAIFISTENEDLLDLKFLEDILKKMHSKYLVSEKKNTAVVISTQGDALEDILVIDDLLSQLEGKFTVTVEDIEEDTIL